MEKKSGKGKTGNDQAPSCIFRTRSADTGAGFAYFSNKENYYLNDASNTPSEVVEALEHLSTKSKGNETFLKAYCDVSLDLDNRSSLKFWADARERLDRRPRRYFKMVTAGDLEESFKSYRARIFENNTG